MCSAVLGKVFKSRNHLRQAQSQRRGSAKLEREASPHRGVRSKPRSEFTDATDADGPADADGDGSEASDKQTPRWLASAG